MDDAEQAKNKLSYIFGKKMRDQARILRLARKEAHKWRKVRLGSLHYGYVLRFCKKHTLLIFGVLTLLFSQGIIEATLIMFSRDYLSDGTRLWLANHFWVLFSVLITLFLINSFFAIKYERSLVVLLINSIRRRLFTSYLSRSHPKLSSETHADLIAKISYHLPLVSLGVSNVFFGVCRWLVYFGIILTIVFLGNYAVFTIVSCIVGLSLVVALGAYLVSRYYASQEVTFYSRIIREMDSNASNIDFVKTFGQEQAVVNKLDKLVWFDSFFRVRRDIFMRIGFKFVFVLLVVVSIVSNFLPTRFFSFIGSVSAADRFLIVFLLMYFARALTESVKIGLYLFPARLGLFLTVVGSTNVPSGNTVFNMRGLPITFHGYKVKLFQEGPYYRNLRFTFQPGERVLFVGDNLSGKTSLAHLFAGISAYAVHAIKVTVGDKRFDFSQWQRNCHDVYFCDPNFKTDRTLMECLLGKVTEDISMEEFATALDTMNQYPSLVQMLSSDGNYNVSASRVLAHPVRAFALHILHCIIRNPYVIVIDNSWLDLRYASILEMIQTLDKANPHSIILIFSHDMNSCMTYTQQYEIKDRFIKIQ